MLAEERAERLVQVGREQEREHDRADADHPADGALGEPEHEEPDEKEDEQQVDRGHPAEELPEVHRPSLEHKNPPEPSGPGRRKGSSGSRRVATGTKVVGDGGGPVRSGAVWWGPDGLPRACLRAEVAVHVAGEALG